MSTQGVILEDVIANKKDLGAAVQFEPGSLEVKQNEYGIRGVFATRPMSAGTVAMSVAVVGGSLTPYRAFEESRDLIAPLGLERFNLSDKFILACAFYLRYTNPDTRHKDLVLPQNDLEDEFAGSPLSCSSSIELNRVRQINSKNFFKNQRNIQKWLARMSVDIELFYMILGYVQSRSWKGNGIIPIFDTVNAASGTDANAYFVEEAEEFRFYLQKDVQKGEEIRWKYNDADALTTWFVYGYMDNNRLAPVTLMVELSNNEQAALETLVFDQFQWVKAEIGFTDKLNENLHILCLYSPGTALSSAARLQVVVGYCMSKFKSVRMWFRIFELIRAANSHKDVTIADLLSDELKFGLEFELRVYSAMRKALKESMVDLQKRIEEFKSSRVGNLVDFTPFLQMTDAAAQEWEAVLTELEALCSAVDLESCMEVIARVTNTTVCAETAQVKNLLEELANEHPSVKVMAVKTHLEARQLI